MLPNSRAADVHIPTRANHPRRLIVYDNEFGEWSSIDDSTEDGKNVMIRTSYLAVSYRQSDFPDKDQLESAVRSACESRNLDAYWLDYACSGTAQDEMNMHFYRIADVFRGAKETLIIIPDCEDGVSGYQSCVAMMSLFQSH